MIRSVIDTYPDRMATGELWAEGSDERFAAYVRPDELHLAFNFRLAGTPFDAKAVRAGVESSLAAIAGVGATPTWTLANHDVARPVTRYGGGATGVARARAMLLLELALPGVVYLYNGEELALPDVDLPDEVLQDPVWERTGHAERGRDGARVPMPWTSDGPGYGFTTGAPWLPMPAGYGELSVETQDADPSSTLTMVRRAVALRRTVFGTATGPQLEWDDAPHGVLAFRRAGSPVTCVLNASGSAVTVPEGEVLLASGPLTDGLLPADTAVWVSVAG
jgi:alpha-glucosidase